MYRTAKEDKTLHTHCTSSGALDVIYRGLDVVQDNMSDIHHFHQHPTLYLPTLFSQPMPHLPYFFTYQLGILTLNRAEGYFHLFSYNSKKCYFLLSILKFHSCIRERKLRK